MQVLKVETAPPPAPRFGQFHAARLLDKSPASAVMTSIGTRRSWLWGSIRT